MSSVPFGARGTFMVASVPPLKAVSGIGQGWLDTGVNPNVLRDYDGTLYQPGGIAPRTGVAGLPKVANGILLLDTFAGLGSGVDLAGRVPTIGAATYADGPDGTAGGAPSGGITCLTQPDSTTTQPVLTLINGIGSDIFDVIATIGTVPPAGAPGSGIGVAVHYGDTNDYIEFLMLGSHSSGSGDYANMYVTVFVGGGGTSLFTQALAGNWANGDTVQLSYDGTNIRFFQNGVDLGGFPHAVTDSGNTGFAIVGQAPLGKTATLSQLVICRSNVITVQGMRPGIGVKLFNSVGGLISSGTASGAGIWSLDIAQNMPGGGGLTGFIQLYTDGTFTTPIAGGRYPNVGNATGIYPGDVFQQET